MREKLNNKGKEWMIKIIEDYNKANNEEEKKKIWQDSGILIGLSDSSAESYIKTCNKLLDFLTGESLASFNEDGIEMFFYYVLRMGRDFAYKNKLFNYNIGGLFHYFFNTYPQDAVSELYRFISITDIKKETFADVYTREFYKWSLTDEELERLNELFLKFYDAKNDNEHVPFKYSFVKKVANSTEEDSINFLKSIGIFEEFDEELTNKVAKDYISLCKYLYENFSTFEKDYNHVLDKIIFVVTKNIAKRMKEPLNPAYVMEGFKYLTVGLLLQVAKDVKSLTEGEITTTENYWNDSIYRFIYYSRYDGMYPKEVKVDNEHDTLIKYEPEAIVAALFEEYLIQHCPK